MKKIPATLVLEDGLAFEGYSFGARGEAIGEVVFNTSMCGYQEIITDPSYKGQIVAMTYPEIGNYGVNEEDVESGRPHLEGFIVKEYHPVPSNFRSRGSLDAYLKRHGVVGIEGIDTRLLTRHLRDCGTKMGIISTGDGDKKRLLKKVRGAPPMVGQDLVREVTCKKRYKWTEEPKERRFHVIAYDFGIKFNSLRNLANAGCDVTVVPASTSSADVIKEGPDGVFLSNGPGDPEPVIYATGEIRKLIGRVPIFGICLGHQLLSLALGGKTYKLKFGHHGGNHPVMDLSTQKVEITAQNHCFAVDIDSLKGKADITHINLNDKTVEGLQHREYPVFSVQYHPEAGPGPHDSRYLFERFVHMMGESA